MAKNDMKRMQREVDYGMERSAGEGTARNNKMMQSMDSYGGQEKPGYKVGYVPPEGNAGPGAKGVYGHDSNPLRVPMKGFM